MKELTKIEEILLLTIWRLKEEAYGVKIRRHISRLTGKEFTYGNLYSALSQLTKKRYVFKHEEESTKARKGWKRMYYSLSPAGLKALKNACEMNEKIWQGISVRAFKEEIK
ncbi:MAG: helix-turn-helix transcriptional regulator [Candidatus Aminicenantes bacterium]|nr:helix-turn-helix transcriptional regulator [Candidatus Aminicenantes bacterium]